MVDGIVVQMGYRGKAGISRKECHQWGEARQFWHPRPQPKASPTGSESQLGTLALVEAKLSFLGAGDHQWCWLSECNALQISNRERVPRNIHYNQFYRQMRFHTLFGHSHPNPEKLQKKPFTAHFHHYHLPNFITSCKLLPKDYKNMDFSHYKIVLLKDMIHR